MSVPFATSRRVEFGDTDMAGIVHFSNFFRYMEAAETDFLLSLGLNVAWADESGERYGFPRVSAACDYHRPARFGDRLHILVVVEHVGTKSVRYRFEFAHAEAPVATGRTTAVFCRKHTGAESSIEPLELPERVRSLLESASGAKS